MDINRLDMRFGAEVTGLDLSRPLDPVAEGVSRHRRSSRAMRHVGLRFADPTY